VVKVIIEDQKIKVMSKTIDPQEAQGAAAGLYRMNAEGINAYFKATKIVYKKMGLQVGFIEPIPLLFDSCPFEPSVFDQYAWFDVDNPTDFERAQKELPEIYAELGA